MTFYDINSLALDAAEDAIPTWATVLDPADARADLRSFLLGSLMAVVDPEVFAGLVERAEHFAGKP